MQTTIKKNLSTFLIRVAVNLVLSDERTCSNVLSSSALALKHDLFNYQLPKLPIDSYKNWLDESSKAVVSLFQRKAAIQEIEKIAKKQASKLLRKHK